MDAGWTGAFRCVELIAEPGQEGDDCRNYGDCDAGLICSHPAGWETRACIAVECDPSGGEPSCADGGACLTTPEWEPVGAGFCPTRDCDPFAAASECAAGESCLILGYLFLELDVLGAECSAGDVVGEGAACGEDARCGEGLSCVSSECRIACHRRADSGEAGSCAAG